MPCLSPIQFVPTTTQQEGTLKAGVAVAVAPCRPKAQPNATINCHHRCGTVVGGHCHPNGSTRLQQAKSVMDGQRARIRPAGRKRITNQPTNHNSQAPSFFHGPARQKNKNRTTYKHTHRPKVTPDWPKTVSIVVNQRQVHNQNSRSRRSSSSSRGICYAETQSPSWVVSLPCCAAGGPATRGTELAMRRL